MRKSFNLAVQALTVQYQGRTALNNIHVTIPSGKITGIIGPNGAGKSTFIKGLLGLIKTKERDVLLNNQAIDQQKTTIFNAAMAACFSFFPGRFNSPKFG